MQGDLLGLEQALTVTVPVKEPLSVGEAGVMVISRLASENVCLNIAPVCDVAKYGVGVVLETKSMAM